MAQNGKQQPSQALPKEASCVYEKRFKSVWANQFLPETDFFSPENVTSDFYWQQWSFCISRKAAFARCSNGQNIAGWREQEPSDGPEDAAVASQRRTLYICGVRESQ